MIPAARRRLVIGLLLFLGSGALLGGFYGYAERGLLIAAVLAVVWQLRQTLNFEKALSYA